MSNIQQKLEIILDEHGSFNTLEALEEIYRNKARDRPMRKKLYEYLSNSIEDMLIKSGPYSVFEDDNSTVGTVSTYHKDTTR